MVYLRTRNLEMIKNYYKNIIVLFDGYSIISIYIANILYKSV